MACNFVQKLSGLASFFGSLLAASPSFAQSLNIALGTPGSPPSPSYAAAGLPGVWNDIGLTPIGVRVPLVGLDGAPLLANLRQVGASLVLDADDPLTSGDDAALLDSMIRSPCTPLDACYWVDDLEPGSYFVTIYALTPAAPTALSPVRVDKATPGSTPVGGAWSGTHVAGVSFQTFLVNVPGGEIGLHSGQPGSGLIAGLNGVQLRKAGAVGVGEILAPQTGSAPQLSAWPNPSAGDQTIELRVPAGYAAERSLTSGASAQTFLDIVDLAGRHVQRLALSGVSGANRVVWDGKQADGLRVVPGVYFVRVALAGNGAMGIPAGKVVRR